MKPDINYLVNCEGENHPHPFDLFHPEIRKQLYLLEKDFICRTTTLFSVYSNYINGDIVAPYAPVPIGSTNANGTVTATLSTTNAEAKTLLAWTGPITQAVRLVSTATITFTAVTVDPMQSEMSATPAQVAADGMAAATVQVCAHDACQNPVGGVSVLLSDTGSGTTLTQPESVTGADGCTSGAIQSTVVEAVTVTATADGIPLVDTAQVSFVEADLAVNKSGPAQALAGDAITYTLFVVNHGLLVAENVVLTDTLPAGTYFVTQTSTSSFTRTGRVLTWELTDLGAGLDASFDLLVTSALTIPHGSAVVNRIEATTTSPEHNLTDNVAEAMTAIHQRQPHLTVDPNYSTLTIRRGETATLTLDVENTGTALASGATASTPAYLGWIDVTPTTLPDLAPGLSTTLTVTLAPPDGQDVGVYRDLVTIQPQDATALAPAFSVRVVDVTRTLAITVSDALTEVVGADVYLVRQEASLLVINGVTNTVHQDAHVQTLANGVAIAEELEEGAYDYYAWATGHGATHGTVMVTNGSGVQVLPVELEGVPFLMPQPAFPTIHVRPGEIGSFEAAVRNVGIGAATNVQVLLPDEPDWLYVGLIGNTQELTGGQSISVTLFAHPPATLTTPALYTQYVEVVADGVPTTGFVLGVDVSDQVTGGLQVVVIDPYGTPVDNAQIALVSQQSTEVVGPGGAWQQYQHFVGETDAGGVVTFPDIPAGYYSSFADAAGYDTLSGEPYVAPGGTGVMNLIMEPQYFTADWVVEETDIYSVTVYMTFEVDRLQVTPLFISAPCEGSVVNGVIRVTNPSTYTVNNVEVTVELAELNFAISGQGASIPPGGVAQFPFTVTVPGDIYRFGRVTASSDEMLDGRSPARVWSLCEDGGDWDWGDPCDGTGHGHYYGPYPYFPGLGDSIVQLRVSQSAMLERQAFIATLALNNGLASIDDLQVYIIARDSDGEPQPTHFTVTPTVPTNLGNMAPGGSVLQSWLIVPADLDITAPTLYTLRARIEYSVGGVPTETWTLPAAILVQPQPEVHLEYHLPQYVRAGEPFLLGVTAENRGYGVARNLRIESAQPYITAQAEEPVSFVIEVTVENGTVMPGDLLLDFGNLGPGESVDGGWTMVGSHHGRFVEWHVRCEHLDYQGMALSNLIWCDGGENIHPNDLQYLNADDCPICTASDKQGFAGGPINTRSGNYGYQTTDLSIPTVGAALQMERSYNSSEVVTTTHVTSETSPMAPGWTQRYAMHLEFAGPDAGPYYTPTITNPLYYWLNGTTIYYKPIVWVQLPRGSLLRFADNGDGTYTSYPGSQATLSRAEVGGVYTYTLKAPDQTTNVFDQYGRLRTIRDPCGNEIDLAYTGELLTHVTGPLGQRWLDLAYDQDQRLKMVTDHTGRYVGYGYDGAGDLVVMTDTLGLAWTYVYTGEHLLYEIRDPLGRLIERTDYDTSARAIYQEDGAGITLTIAYGDDGTTVVEAGREKQQLYDLFGALVGEVDAQNNSQSYVYNNDFQRESTTDALGRTTRMEWRACCGRLSAITDTLGHATHMEYDALNNLKSRTDALDRTTRYLY